MNNKILLGVFGLLLIIYLGSKLFSNNKTSSFDAQVVLVDTSLIDQLVLYPKSAPGESITLTKSNGIWKANNGNMEVVAVTNSVNSLLAQMSSIRAKRIVSNSPDKWEDYEVDQNSGTRVEAFSNRNKISDFIVGAFKYDQTTQAATSYIRRADEDPVYSVDGFLGMAFNQSFDYFRNKELLKLNKDDITKLTLSNGSDPMTFQKLNDNWFLAGMEQIDSTSMAGYLNGLSTVSGFEFAEQAPPGTSKVATLNIEANNMMDQVEISLYGNPNTEPPFILNSSLNPEAYFYSDSSGIYQRIFGKLLELQP